MSKRVSAQQWRSSLQSAKKSITQELAESYRVHLKKKIKAVQPKETATVLNKVCIVGGGMAGMYAALLMKENRPNVAVKIFEATNRLGGRVYTHKFSDLPNQYFEAGAMRLPVTTWQMPVFALIDYLNVKLPEYQINLIPYQYSYPSGNRVYVNSTKQADHQIMSVNYANANLGELGFPPEADATEEAGKLLQDAIDPIVDALKTDFDAALALYDNMTLQYYLLTQLGWTQEKINYVEVMSSQTNEFRTGLVDQAILNSDFTGEVVNQWYTIENGMYRLTEAMSQVIGSENIVLQAPVESLQNLEGGGVSVGYLQSDNTMAYETFDAVILALPPSAVRMIPTKPVWPVALEHGLRSIHFQPLYKIGLRFNSRFWERDTLRPSYGGQSTTDLPCRWVVYPSNGLGDTGQGVLLLYSWMTDSNHWLPKSDQEKIKMALLNLQTLYPEVDVAGEYAGGTDETSPSYLNEAFPVEWAVKWPLGDATFYAGQFSYLYPVMKEPQGEIYFSGEHLSVYRSWIAGALDSATETVSQLLGETVSSLT